MKNSRKLNLWRATMDNNFLEAFENSNTLQEGIRDTLHAKNQVNKQIKANAEKQNAANVNADVANKNGYQQIIASLQKIANEQVQFDEKSIDKYITNINNLKSLDDKSKKQINQMLNQQKTALQQAAADKGAIAEKNTTIDKKTAEKGGAVVENDTGEVDKTEESQNNIVSGAGDSSKINDSEKNTLKSEIDKITSFGNGEVSIDDIIAFIQSLKQ